MSLKSQSQEEAGLVCRANGVVLDADQAIFLCYHLEIYLLFSRGNKCNEKKRKSKEYLEFHPWESKKGKITLTEKGNQKENFTGVLRKNEQIIVLDSSISFRGQT